MTNRWYAMSLGDGVTALEPLRDVENRFRAASEQAGRPRDMAVFTRHESEGRLHCELMVYFSPAARAVAQALGAQPCARPSPQGLSLLAGPAESWSLLFPGPSE